MDTTTIWFKDIKKFITKDNYLDFFPSKGMNFTEQMNSIMRFSIYFTVILYFLKNDYKILFITIFMAMLTYILYTINKQKVDKEREKFQKKNEAKDNVTKEACQLPSKDNPFMNVLISDLPNNTDNLVANKKKACDIGDPAVKSMTNKYFNQNLYRDVDDVFGKNATDRNYITQPSTTVPSDQDAFLKFVFDLPPSCKQDNIMCYRNVHNINNIR